MTRSQSDEVSLLVDSKWNSSTSQDDWPNSIKSSRAVSSGPWTGAEAGSWVGSGAKGENKAELRI